MKCFSMPSVLLLLGSGMMVYADIVPYSDPAGQGTQNWGGNLALLFQVNSPITVNELGVFNASGSGLITGTIQVGIYNSLGSLVTPVVTFHGQYTASGYDIFQSILPILLGPGSYEVDAVGFSASDPNGNLNTGSSSGPILNDDGGRLTFQGAAYDASSGLDDPTTCVSCQGPPAQYRQFDAGTFGITPEPAFYGVLALGLAGLFLGVRRRKSRLS
jgi:hypothetical protein